MSFCVRSVAAITSKFALPPYPTEVVIEAPEGGLKDDSVVLTNQIRTVDKQRLTRRLGRVTPETLHEPPRIPRRRGRARRRLGPARRRAEEAEAQKAVKYDMIAGRMPRVMAAFEPRNAAIDQWRIRPPKPVRDACESVRVRDDGQSDELTCVYVRILGQTFRSAST